MRWAACSVVRLMTHAPVSLTTHAWKPSCSEDLKHQGTLLFLYHSEACETVNPGIQEGRKWFGCCWLSCLWRTCIHKKHLDVHVGSLFINICWNLICIFVVIFICILYELALLRSKYIFFSIKLFMNVKGFLIWLMCDCYW